MLKRLYIKGSNDRSNALPILLVRIAFRALQITTIASFVIVANGQQRGRVVNANDYPGRDIGAKINAADKALGAQPGEIVIKGGGTIATQVIISSDHVLRVMPGTYAATTPNIPILMKPRSSVIGSGWEAIILESTAPGQFTVISAYNNSILNGSADAGVVIRNVQIKGANPGFNSAPQAISLGNCSGCLVDKVWINGTRSIGVQLGGSSMKGNFADNSKVTNCLFTRVASQNLALVNGRNITFEGNRFIAAGQRGGPGSTNIDLEPNEPTDHIENVIIRNNFIDVHESEMPTTGNGIVVQATTGTTYVGPILIENNQIIGGVAEGSNVTNVLSNGIYVFGDKMRDVSIRNNVITRTGQSGISVEGTRIIVAGNRLRDVGGGGIPGFRVNANNSQIVNNTLTSGSSGIIDSRMIISAGSRNNVVENNRGFVVVHDTQ
ncbi:MAG TPA: right-handed parallel beta-helix repeat-containing protein [Pyrinomonadaceae bacterium]|nr:right-handed parallel beta-helix repeat-containing protein [Pyrinomonadaceae bacterium]